MTTTYLLLVSTMHSLIDRIVLGLTCTEVREGEGEGAQDTPTASFQMTEDAVRAWTELYGAEPDHDSFSEIVNEALTQYLKARA